MLVKIKSEIKDLATEEIYKEMKPFLISRFNKLPHFLEFDDYMSLAKITFMRVIKNYKVEFGKAFITYLGIALDSDICTYINRNRDRSVKAISLDQELTTETDRPIPRYESIEDQRATAEMSRAEYRALIKQLTRKVTKEDMLIMELYYYKDMSQTEISKIIGMSQVSISRRLKNVLKIMRREIRCIA